MKLDVCQILVENFKFVIPDDEQNQLGDSARNEISASVDRNSTSFPLCKNYNWNGILLSGFTTQPFHDKLRPSQKVHYKQIL